MDAKFFPVSATDGTELFINPQFIVRIVQGSKYSFLYLAGGESVTIALTASEIVELARKAK